MDFSQEQEGDQEIDSFVAEEPQLDTKRFPDIEPIPSSESDREPEPEAPVKHKKSKYNVSPAVIERNRKLAAENKRRRAENKKKLEEYEKLVKLKGVSSEDVERVLNEKLTQLEERLASRRAVAVPPKLESIPEAVYTSDTERRFSNRFKREPTSPSGYARFRS